MMACGSVPAWRSRREVGSHEMVRGNGHEAQNGHRELSTECESYSGSESGSVYRSHMVTEKKYSVERQSESRRSRNRQVSCQT